MDNAEAADAVRKYAQNSPLSTVAGRDLVVRADWAGNDNLLWRLGSATNGAATHAADIVIKMYMDAGWVRGRREHEAQQLFAPLGIAPQPLWFDRDAEQLPRQVVAYRWVEGDAPDTSNADDMRALADAIGTVHASDPAAMPRISPHPATFDTYQSILLEGTRAVREELSVEPELVTAFDALAAAAAHVAETAAPLWKNAGPSPIHGDFTPENAVISPAGLTLLDWELSGLGDPALEVARFVQGHLSNSSLQEVWLNDYLARADNEAMAAHIAVYRRLLPLEWFCDLMNGLPEAFSIYGAEIQSDMVKLLDVVFSASAESLAVPRTLNTATIRRMVKGMSTRGTS